MKLREFDFSSIPKTKRIEDYTTYYADVVVVIYTCDDAWYIHGESKNILENLLEIYGDREIEKSYWVLEKFIVELEDV